MCRRDNAAVVLATQSLSQLARLPNRHVLLESCPTKIFLPNPDAASPGTAALYAGIDNLFDKDPPNFPGANGSGNNVLFNPVGRMFRSDNGPWFTVVGIVADMRRQGIEFEPIPQMFEAMTQNPSGGGILVLRTSAPDPSRAPGKTISEPICGEMARSSQESRSWRNSRASGPRLAPLGVTFVRACRPTS